MKNIRGVLILVIVSIFWMGTPQAIASPLENRLGNYPNWEHKPLLQEAQEDLIYPAWMAGTWKVTSTLVDLVAPLAPNIVTPAFEENRQYLEQPIQFQVRFVSQIPTYFPVLQPISQSRVVADRKFNGFNIAKAYLGDQVVAVQVDPQNPNRQITLLRGNLKLQSTVTARAQERSTPNQFLTTEITQQLFRSPTQIYLNEVETTTAYELTNPTTIEADQVTAIYLSPQDPDYFRAIGHPVSLYRYRLKLEFMG